MSIEEGALSDIFPVGSREGEQPAFTLDHSNRIISWNGACATLFGRSSADVLGRACYEVVLGNDIHDNLYCYPNCPVMYQLRSLVGRQINDFSLRVPTEDSGIKSISFSSRAIRDADSPASILHVLRPNQDDSLLRAEEMAKRLDSTTFAQLTRRELDVIHCLAKGMTTRRIAKALSITSTTVRNHVQSILQKLNVHTRVAAVSLAYQHGLITE